MPRRRTLAVTALVLVAGVGAAAAYLYATGGELSVNDLASRQFHDQVATNADVSADQVPLTFTDSDGKPVSLGEYRGKKNVLLVFTRGYNGSICMFCSAQLSRLVRNHAEFARRDTEVLMVFPGPKDHLGKLLADGQVKADNAAVPFRILLDPDFAAVDKLGIRGSLAKPSTYILDKQGKVRFAYVGASASDRPSIKGMTDQLDRLAKEGAAP
jgi:peroxiredoxin